MIRLAAFLIGLLAVGLRIAFELLVLPHSDSVWVWTLGSALVAGVPLGIMLLITGWRRRRPKSFRLRQNAFLAPTSEQYGPLQAVLMMALGVGPLASALRDGDQGRVVFGGILAIPFLVAATLLLLIRRPYVVLTPSGIIVQRLRRRVELDWDELAPGGPMPPVKRNERLMRLYLMQTPIAEQWFASEDLPVGLLHIDPAFLADAVRHYIENPEHRAAIGTQSELDRLPDRLYGSLHE